MKRRMTVLFAVIICIMMLFAYLYPAFAETDMTALWLKCEYKSPASPTSRSWSFPYSDSWFEGSASEYNHCLAQCSLGMALSAFRNWAYPLEKQGDEARSYLRMAGFDRFSAGEYNIMPTPDTIATMLASKQMNGFTLVAAAVSGAGYKREWTGNFTIDDGERHSGFAEAAEKVKARIREYLESEGITGSVKLWISGFSRAAAVSNLTAADMTDSGLFDDVFAYTFATPNNAKAIHREFDNIFNIIGKFDPVPAVPFSEWGYGRYGKDLYTPAQETDSDYYLRKQRADSVSQKLTGMPFWNNLQINSITHTILDFLLDILPTSALYRDHMQDIVLSIMGDGSLDNFSKALNILLEDKEFANDRAGQEIEGLLDYLSLAVYTTASSSLAGGSSWNSQTGFAENLMHEHSPDVYLAWMFSSDDPDEIFTDEMRYLRVTYDGEITATVTDADGSFIFAIDPEGKVSYANNVVMLSELSELTLDKKPQIPVERKGTQNMLTIPKDNAYCMVLTADRARSLILFGTHYTVGQMNGRINEVYYAEVDPEGRMLISFPKLLEESLTGEGIYFTEEPNDVAIKPFDEDEPYSPAFVARLENYNVFHLTWRQMGYIAIGGVVLILAGLTVGTVACVKKVRRGRRLKRDKLEQADSSRQST